jgi:hypothetical protein
VHRRHECRQRGAIASIPGPAGFPAARPDRIDPRRACDRGHGPVTHGSDGGASRHPLRRPRGRHAPRGLGCTPRFRSDRPLPATTTGSPRGRVRTTFRAGTSERLVVHAQSADIDVGHSPMADINVGAMDAAVIPVGHAIAGAPLRSSSTSARRPTRPGERPTSRNPPPGPRCPVARPTDERGRLGARRGSDAAALRRGEQGSASRRQSCRQRRPRRHHCRRGLQAPRARSPHPGTGPLISRNPRGQSTEVGHGRPIPTGPPKCANLEDAPVAHDLSRPFGHVERPRPDSP